jgi:hypothetical protein
MLAVGWSVAAAPAVEIQVSPSTVNLEYEGTAVTVHAEIPYRGVVTASLLLNGVEVWRTFADNRGELVAKFDVDSVKNIIAPPSATLTLTGVVETEDGEQVPFSGVDVIKVIDRSGKK